MPDLEPRSPRKPSPLAPPLPLAPRAGSGLELRAAQPEPTEADFDPSPETPLPPWAEGWIDTGAGRVLRVKSAPLFRDRLDLLRSRLVRRRERIRVAPGLYALGSPGDSTPVFVTANYKPSFDALRFALSHRDAWLLVLDTGGVNVWCAAGKGRFGDAELLRRLRASGLERIAPRADLVLPQLGATGVGAWKIAKETGRRVRVGPVRAADLGAWLDS
ncbi:MAG TPA: mercury methylation corrinoid protein HgcA, partial [Spirochaetales bacterium]|nr:mercury methylation corrinoid protein HgcA [Spirochaetales bacterium]